MLTDVRCYLYLWLVAYLQGGTKNWHTFLYALTLPDINRFSALFHCQNRRTFVIILSVKIPPHLKCVVTLPCEMSVS